jgi:hypothetical protein
MLVLVLVVVIERMFVEDEVEHNDEEDFQESRLDAEWASHRG